MNNKTKELIKSYFSGLTFDIRVKGGKLFMDWNAWYGSVHNCVAIVSLTLLNKQLIHLRKDKDSNEVKISVQIYSYNYHLWCKFENTLTDDHDYIDIKYERKRRKKK